MTTDYSNISKIKISSPDDMKIPELSLSETISLFEYDLKKQKHGADVYYLLIKNYTISNKTKNEIINTYLDAGWKKVKCFVRDNEIQLTLKI